MKITKATFYLHETEPQVRQVRYADRGGKYQGQTGITIPRM